MTKTMENEVVQLELSQLVTSLEDEYTNTITLQKPSNEANSTNYLTRIQALHAKTKKYIIQKGVKTFENYLSNKIDKLCENFRDDSIEIEKSTAEAKQTAETLAQLHYLNLKNKVQDLEENGLELLQEFHEQEGQLILEDFQVLSHFPKDTAAFETLRFNLAINLEKQFQNLKKEHVDWKLMIEKVRKQVEKVYEKDLQKAIGQYDRSLLVPPQVCFKLHEKVAQIAISKCIFENSVPIIPVSTQVLLALKKILDLKHRQKISDHIVVGIDLGIKYARAAVYYQGKVHNIPHVNKNGNLYNSITGSFIGGVEGDDGYIDQQHWETPMKPDLKEVKFSWAHTQNQSSVAWSFTGQQAEQPAEIRRKSSLPLSRKNSSARETTAQIVSKLLERIRENTKTFLDISVCQCVITVPFYFDDEKKAMILEAGQMAGFTKIMLQDEIIALALAHQFVSKVTKKVMLVNAGEKYWEFIVLEGTPKKYTLRPVYRYDGGFQLKDKLVNYCVEQFCQVESLSPNQLASDTSNAKIRRRLLFESCDKAITLLSSQHSTVISIPDFFNDIPLNIRITRTEFELLNEKEFKKFGDVVNGKSEPVTSELDGISDIILAGYYSGIPKMQKTAKTYFNGTNVIIPSNELDIEPEEIMAFGAALKGVMLAAVELKQKSK